MSNVWSIAVFIQKGDYEFPKDSLDCLVKTFNGKKIRKERLHIHTYADPFLFVYKNELYLFAEIQNISSKGYIAAWKTTNFKEWQHLGVVLRESFHLSYPFIFWDEEKDRIYLMPESVENNDICLYEFESFPDKPKRINQILKGNYADSSLIKHEGIYYLITTNVSNDELELFYSQDLYSSMWCKHPANPISKNNQINRNGGGFVKYGDRLYRIAQNNSNRYGGGIVILEVTELDKFNYNEVIVASDYRPFQNYRWQTLGRHHLSLMPFNGKIVIAIDGLQSDFSVNKFVNLFFKLFAK